MKIQAGPVPHQHAAGLQLAQRMLDTRKGVNKQIFMITDGKPSAIREYGRLYKNPFGLDPKIVNKTLEEAAYCRKKRITITTFMLATDAPLLEFVRKLTELNHGRHLRDRPEQPRRLRVPRLRAEPEKAAALSRLARGRRAARRRRAVAGRGSAGAGPA